MEREEERSCWWQKNRGREKNYKFKEGERERERELLLLIYKVSRLSGGSIAILAMIALFLSSAGPHTSLVHLIWLWWATVRVFTVSWPTSDNMLLPTATVSYRIISFTSSVCFTIENILTFLTVFSSSKYKSNFSFVKCSIVLRSAPCPEIVTFYRNKFYFKKHLKNPHREYVMVDLLVWIHLGNKMKR